MISFTDVQSSDELHNLAPLKPFDISFHGQSVDERGQATISFLEQHSTRSFCLDYDYKKFAISIDDKNWRINQLNEFIRQVPTEKVLLDSTTLNSIELALIIRAYSSVQDRTEFAVLYAEPAGYAPKLDDDDITNNHAFDLSTNLQEDSYTVPGFKTLLKSDKESHVIIVAGFEKERLGALLNGLESQHVKECTLIFGIPPFQPSMEIHSLMQNAPLLDNKAIKSIDFTGANNPMSTFKAIDRIKQGLADNEVLELAPIGPKPSTLACALYAAYDKTVGLRYDFPKPAKGRTHGIGRTCLYSTVISKDIN